MKKIPLNLGKFTLVDDEDFERFKDSKWYLVGTVGYAGRNMPGKSRELLHRLILEVPPGRWVDHINGDSLDNRRSNLRVCTRSQNAANQRRKSGVKGVTCRARGTWRARISKDGISYHLGDYDNLEAALAAYDQAAKRLFGEFACVNSASEG